MTSELVFTFNYTLSEILGAVFVRNPLNRELVATFEIIVSVHDNASEVIDKSGSVPNGTNVEFIFSFICIYSFAFILFYLVSLITMWPSLLQRD